MRNYVMCGKKFFGRRLLYAFLDVPENLYGPSSWIYTITVTGADNSKTEQTVTEKGKTATFEFE